MSVKSKQESRLWDVFIYEYATRKIETAAGTALPESGSFHTVAVPAGLFKKGDTLPTDVEEYA